MFSEKSVLSIQSHVIHGYVGNKSAVFPLQLLGFETDAINSVQFSNHTGYQNGFEGQCLNDVQLEELIDGLRNNDLATYDFVINGYVGTKTFLSKLGSVIKTLKANNPTMKYVCDPVMGDVEPVGWYVPKDLLPVYKNEVIPLADVCLPNEFELGLLTGMTIKCESDAINALKMLNEMGPGIAVLTSCYLEDHMLSCYATSKSGACAKIVFPKFPVAFVGSGDLFTAEITAWLSKTNFDIFATLENTVATMQAVLGRTVDHIDANRKAYGLSSDDVPPAVLKELRVIQSKRDIEDPTVRIKAERIVV